MQVEFNAIDATMERIKTDMRMATYVHVSSRIGAALESQGTADYFSGPQTVFRRRIEDQCEEGARL